MTECYKISISFSPVTRRIIVKAEQSRLGRTPRFVVTNLPQTDKSFYETVCCVCGGMENRINDQQSGLFADRMPCQSRCMRSVAGSHRIAL